METLKLVEPEKVEWDYDAGADTLYISLGEPQKALALDLGNGILARYDEHTEKIVGLTIIGIGHVLTKHRRAPLDQRKLRLLCPLCHKQLGTTHGEEAAKLVDKAVREARQIIVDAQKRVHSAHSSGEQRP